MQTFCSKYVWQFLALISQGKENEWLRFVKTLVSVFGFLHMSGGEPELL